MYPPGRRSDVPSIMQVEAYLGGLCSSDAATLTAKIHHCLYFYIFRGPSQCAPPQIITWPAIFAGEEGEWFWC